MRQLLCVLALASCGIAEAEPAKPSPVTVALQTDGRYTALIAALQSTGVDAALAVHDPFTVLAATDDAFMKLSEKRRERLLGNKERLGAYLREHVLVGSFPPNAIPDETTVWTLAGTRVTLRNDEEVFLLGNYRANRHPITTSNAVIYQIDIVP